MRDIGIMQGRLLPPVSGNIQAYPGGSWPEEFVVAKRVGLSYIEWIYDDYPLQLGPPNLNNSQPIYVKNNALASKKGIADIFEISTDTGVEVRSVCADYFMRNPLLNGSTFQREANLRHLYGLIRNCVHVGAEYIVLPFVDETAIDFSSLDAVDWFVATMRRIDDEAAGGVYILLETNLPPGPMADVLKRLSPRMGVLYDTGNSASLGYNLYDEWLAYGDRIHGIHIKDRVLNGGTVPLGEGNVDWKELKERLARHKYDGPIIIQAARGKPTEEEADANRSLEFVRKIV